MQLMASNFSIMCGFHVISHAIVSTLTVHRLHRFRMLCTRKYFELRLLHEGDFSLSVFCFSSFCRGRRARDQPGG